MSTAIAVVLAMVVGLLAVLVVGLLRSHAEILRALHDLGIGEDGPHGRAGGSSTPTFQVRPGVSLPRGEEASGAVADLVGLDPWGDPVSVAVAGAAHRTLLVFLSSGCLTCQDFWNAFATPSGVGLRADVRPVIVVKDPAHESMARVQELAPAAVPVVSTGEAWEAYGIPVAPYFVLVDGPTDRVLGEGAAGTWEQVRNLLDQALDDLAAVEGEPWQRGRRAAAVRLDEIAEAELRRAGITPGHPSLYGDDPPTPAEVAALGDAAGVERPASDAANSGRDAS
jgi:hypothetical protein